MKAKLLIHAHCCMSSLALQPKNVMGRSVQKSWLNGGGFVWNSVVANIIAVSCWAAILSDHRLYERRSMILSPVNNRTHLDASLRR
uniref:7TM_GPCR_Srx domain-containing protein n=1 Tax=Ascaris lumbricoides TaxID=6252 RepID=A0A0M3HWJ3_ASCLU